MTTHEPAVTHNQPHVARNETPGQRRVSIYWAWSYPLEAGRGPRRDREPLLHNDRSAYRRLARLRNTRIRTRQLPAGIGGPLAGRPSHLSVEGCGEVADRRSLAESFDSCSSRRGV